MADRAAASKRALLSFQRRAVTSDDDGGTQGDWAEEFKAHAELIPRFGGETVMAARLSDRQPTTIKVRSTPAAREVTTAWRIVDQFTGTLYAITSISKTDQRNRELEFLCESGRNLAQ